LEGEPIAINITIFNTRSKDIMVEFDDRFAPGQHGFHFAALDVGLFPSPLTLECDECTIDMLRPLQVIPPGQTWVTLSFLQRFLLQPRPGDYSLPYTLELGYLGAVPDPWSGQWASCIDSPRPPIPRHKAFTKGVLHFVIDPSSREKLDMELERYDPPMFPGNVHNRYWEDRSAALDALSVVDDAVVVGHLARALVADPDSSHIILEDALVKFQNDEGARETVIDALYSERTVIAALRVLATWKHKLTADAVASLLRRYETEAHIIRAIKEYATDVDR
jgi:hypothetical protein